jgi:tetratricopeptide (TPR) repeat protein
LKMFESSSLEDEESILYMYEPIYQFQQAGAWSEAFNASRRFVPELVSRGVREVRELLVRFDPKIVPRDQLADFHIMKGDSYSLNENWDEALKDYQTALKLKGKSAPKEDLAHLHSSIAEAQMHIKQWSDMIKSHQSALKLFEESKNQKGIAKELIALGTSYKAMKRYDESLESYNKCIKMLEEAEDKLGIAVALNNVALVYESMGAWRKAKDSIEKSLGYLEGKEYEVERARVLYNLGGLLFNRGQHENAIEAYSRSLELFNKHKHDGAINSAIRLGDIHLAKKDLERALSFYQNARSIHESRSKSKRSVLGRKEPKPDPSIALITEKLVDTSRKMGDWEQLVNFLREDINRLEVLKDNSGLPPRYLELGLALENLELLETAYKSILKARTILETKKELNGLIAVDLNLGRIYKKAGDEERSVQAYKRALANAKKSGNKSAIAVASAELGL